MVEDKLIELLESTGYEAFRQGSFAKDEKYPDTFITYWNNSETLHSAYDNNDVMTQYDYSVNVYSNNPTTTYDLLRVIRDLLKTNGWTITDRGHDVLSDEKTHTGRGINVIFLKNEL